jgi:hypothetical protein
VAVRLAVLLLGNLVHVTLDAHSANKTRTNKNAALVSGVFVNLERETRLELATPTLARSCSTN